MQDLGDREEAIRAGTNLFIYIFLSEELKALVCMLHLPKSTLKLREVITSNIN